MENYNKRDMEDLEKKSKYDEFKKFRNREILYQKAMIERLEARHRASRLTLAALSITFASLIFSFSGVLLDDGKYIDKIAAQKELSSIILNGGDLRAIKQALENQSKISEVKLILSSKDNYYPKGVALSYVLEDVRVEAFRSNNMKLLPKLDPIISEHEEVNPFDKLKIGQKDYFDNLRIKTGSDYKNISNDVNNLADELHQKNQLVDEYLSDSKMSFWISIFAVFLSIAIGGYQIFTGRPEALKKLLLSLLAEPNGEGNSQKKNPADG